MKDYSNIIYEVIKEDLEELAPILSLVAFLLISGGIGIGLIYYPYLTIGLVAGLLVIIYMASVVARIKERS